jgi:hypothetical protein
MTDSLQHDPLQALWQSQPHGERQISVEQVREWAGRLERRVARRNLREYVGAVVVVLGYGLIGWRVPAASVRLGAGLVIAAAIFIVYTLHTKGSSASLPADAGTISSLEFFRAQLERQRDLLRSVWRWYLLPFVPGGLVLMIGRVVAEPSHTLRVVAFGGSVLLLMLGVHALNRYGANRIQRVLDRLNNNT